MSSADPIRYETDVDRDVGTSVQLFLDDEDVHEVKNIRRVFHRPRKHPANPLISQDRPWEHYLMFQISCYSVVYDDERGRFVCFYEDSDPPRRDDRRSPYDRMAGRTRARVLIAFSDDGIRWQKPDLAGTLHDGEPTNIVLGDGVHAFSVLFDPRDRDPHARYKMVYTLVQEGLNRPKRSRWPNDHSNGMHLATSPDGIDWTPHPGNPVAQTSSDVQVLTYDEDREVYVVMGRALGWGSSQHPELDKFFPPSRPSTPPGARLPKRLVTRIESTDLLRWSEPTIVLAPDESDNLDDEHYGLVHWQRGQRSVGLLSVLHAVPNTMDLELVSSRDGRAWRRYTHRAPVIPLGRRGDPDEFIADCTSPPIDVGDEQWIYYGASARRHDISWQPPEDVDPEEIEIAGKTHLALATLRRDGWCSLTAMDREGYVETEPLFSHGSRLLVNARCEPGGYVACELRDPWGHVWPGFERERCEVFRGDEVAHEVTWEGRTQVDEVPGDVRIRFYLRRANLFAFRFAES